MTAGYYRSGI